MAQTLYDERMSESDALTWTIERDPVLRSTIVGVWILDRGPDPDRLLDKMERATRTIPRLRQRVVEDPLHAAPPRWATDPRFDLSYHVRRVRAPGEGRLRDVLDLAEPAGMQAFDRDRPLWEVMWVDDLAEGRAAIVLKLHHAMSDGVGLVRMTESLIERSREPDAEAVAEPLPPEPSPAADEELLERTLEALRYRAGQRISEGRHAAGAVVRGLAHLVRHPVDAVGDAMELAGSAARLLAPASEPLTPLPTMRQRSLSLRLHAFSRRLEPLKQAAKSVGGTLNDAFVAGVAGGMRRYHEAHGVSPSDLGSLRMTMPINLRPMASSREKARYAGNQFAPVRFEVPVGILDPRERMRAIHRLVARERDEPSLPAVAVIASALNRLPAQAATAAFGGMLKTVDLITSNVPGPPFSVYLAGARLEHIFGFGPLSGAATNITLFSYDGDVEIGVASDRVAIPDGDRFHACLEEGLDEVTGPA